MGLRNNYQQNAIKWTVILIIFQVHSTSAESSGGIQFTPFDSELRIYLAAPSGVLVAQVRASDPKYPNVNPEYKLMGNELVLDHQYFMIDSASGNISTKRYIDRPVGATYNITVTAFTPDNRNNFQYSIRVSEYNRFPPIFDSSQYVINLDILTPANTSIMKVHATDRDVQKYNSQIFYSINRANTVLTVNRTTGELILREHLSPQYRDLVFTILASDGGSPRRVARTKLTILVKILSTPLDIGIEITTSNSASICWRKPKSGIPLGFVFFLANATSENDTFAYKDIFDFEKTRNITVDNLGVAKHDSDKLCNLLTELESKINYSVRMAAWNSEEIGIISTPISFKTQENHCGVVHDCLHGICKRVERSGGTASVSGYECLCSPGFKGPTCEEGIACDNETCGDEHDTCNGANASNPTCGCNPGFYGVNCSLYNPCFSIEPICMNGGACKSNASNEFQCQCLDGYYGERCEKFDPCSVAPCQHGACIILDSSNYHCECNPGFTGRDCEVNINECASNPCQNNGRCIDDLAFYVCQCIPGYEGDNCEIGVNACISSPCLHGAKCVDTNDKYICKCPIGYEGDHCEHEVNECASSPCLHGGVCYDLINDFLCHCPNGFTGKTCATKIIDLCAKNPCKNGGKCTDKGDHLICTCASGYAGSICEIKASCHAETVRNEKGEFSWQNTGHGTIARLPCPYGTVATDKSQDHTEQTSPPVFEFGARIHPKKTSQKPDDSLKTEKHQREIMEQKLMVDADGAGYAVRSCLLRNNVAAWTTMLDDVCKVKAVTRFIAPKVPDEKGKQLEFLTNDPTQINASMFILATIEVQDILLYALHDSQVAQNMINIVSNLMGVNESVLEAADSDGNRTGQLINIIESYAKDADIGPTSHNISINSLNLALEALEIGLDESETKFVEGITFTPTHKINSNLQDENRDSNDTVNLEITEDISINIPSEALLRAAVSSNKARVYFVSFKNSKFFRARSGSNQNTAPNAPVLIASISNVKVDNLTDAVTYGFPNNKKEGNHVCAFWSPEDQQWFQRGLSTNQTNEMIYCQSIHLTAFSVLLDPDPHHMISEYHQLILSYISYIGSGFSLAGLIFTIVTYSLFRCLNRDRSGKILLNLCISLVMMNLSFLMVSVQEYVTLVNLCMTNAILTHYFVLTSLSWMLVEAVNMYQLLVTVFATTETRFMVKRMLCAWGFPFLIVAAAASSDINFYMPDENDYCLVSAKHPQAYYISYLGPSCIILAINCVVFLLVSRILFQRRTTGNVRAISEQKITVAQVRGAFTVMTLLGVAWIFGALAIGEFKLTFQYLFCIFNSLQGFIIFLVRCVHYSEARMAWTTLLRTGKFKKYRGVIPTSSSRHTSSSYSQTTRNTSLDNNTVSTASFWNRIFSKKSHHKPKINTYSSASLRNNAVDSRHPNYPQRNGQKLSRVIRKDPVANNITPIRGVIMTEMQSLPSSRLPGDYRPHIPNYFDKNTCNSLQGNRSASLKSTSQTQNQLCPFDISKRAWSQESLTDKEGEDTSWQFLRVPEHRKREPSTLLLGAIKKVPPSYGPGNGQGAWRGNGADQGYMTGEQSPERTQKFRHFQDIGPHQNVPMSKVNDVIPTERNVRATKKRKVKTKVRSSGRRSNTLPQLPAKRYEDDQFSRHQVNNHLKLLYLKNPLLIVDEVTLEDCQRYRRSTYGNLSCRLHSQNNTPLRRSKSFTLGSM